MPHHRTCTIDATCFVLVIWCLETERTGSSVSVEEAWFIRVGLCALKIVPLCLFSWTATTPPQTQQGVVISATSGLLFHISQLWGNQIRPDELSGRWTRATHRLRHTDTHTLTQWCQAQQQWHTNKLPQQPCRTTYTQMSRWQKCHTGFFFFKEWMDRRGECARVRMSRVHRGTCRIHSYHPPTSFSAVRDVTAIWFLSISFCIFKLY